MLDTGLLKKRRPAEQYAVFVAPHMRHFATAAQRHWHSHAEQADGQLSGDDWAALQQINSYYGGW